MITSRTFLKIALALGTLTVASLGSGSTALADGPWCAQAGGRGGYTNCGYHTFQQCLDSVRGAGGSCSPNPALAYERVYRPYRVYR
jgi:Protein of unknown function (DUF3551)